MTEPQRVFDGHNDVLLRLWRHDRSGRAFFNERADGHIDLPKAKRGGLCGGLFAAFVPPAPEPQRESERRGVVPRVPASTPSSFLSAVDQDDALAITLGQFAVALRVERISDGAVTICRSAAEVTAAHQRGQFAMVLHLEGAEAIDADFEALDVLHAAGLRSLGPLWSRPTIFGTGVPFRFPSTPDVGDGLTERGLALVRACNDLGIMVDCSHLNERSFWDVARLSAAPLVATHSNAHAVCPSARNLTDAQMDAIRDTDGLVGLNFATFFIRPDGKRISETPLSMMTRHLDHMLKKLGPTGVALGSDFDGAPVPAEIGDASGLPRLVHAMRLAGYDDDLIDAICYRNWIDLLARTLK